MASSLAHVALAAVTALSWLGLGALVLRPLPATGDRLLDLLNRVAAGAIAFALVTFAAGLAGLLYPAVYLPVLALTAVAGAADARRLLAGAHLPSIRGWARWELALAALTLVYVLVCIFVTAAPISSTDALAYHATAPAIFERTHHVQELSWSWPSYQPFSVEMLMLDGFLAWDFVQGAYAPLLLALAAVAAIAGAAHRLAGRRVAVLAAAIFVAQPFMVWAATSAFVEPALAFLLILSAWNLFRYIRGGGTDALVLAGVFAGGGAGIKYVGVATAAALGFAGVLLARRRLDRRAILAFVVPAVLVALPWYVKNAIQTGDPLYPLIKGDPNPAGALSRRQVLEGYGAGRSVVDALLLPFNLLRHGNLFDRGDFMSPLFLMFAPLALLDRRARRPGAVVLAASLLYVGAWFVSSQQARFLVPLMAPLSVLAALGIVALSAGGRVGRLAAVAVSVAAFATGAGVTAVYASQFVPVVTGFTSADAFLTRKAIYYEGTTWLNRHLPRDARVLYGPSTGLYIDRQEEGWTLDALSNEAGRPETLSYFRRVRPTNAAVLSTDTDRLRQLRYVHAHLIASVTVHEIYSRTRDVLSPPETMLVFSVPRVAVSRVTVTAPPSRGHSGVSDYARLLGAALERAGFELVEPGRHECAVLNFTPFGAGVAWGWLRAMREARSLARGGKTLVVVFHEVFVRPDDRLRMRVYERLQRLAHRSLARRARAVVTSDDARARALAALVPDAQAATVIPVGANVPVPEMVTGRADEPVIAAFGLLHPLRDVETLVAAAALLREHIPTARVVVLGDLGTDPARARRLADEVQSFDAPVTFTGPLDASLVAAELGHARVFASTYLESLSLGSGTLAAAFGHGLAVVVYEDAALASPLEAGLNLIAAARDPAALADALARALGPEGDAFAAAGRSVYDTSLSWDSIGARFAALLTAVPTP